MTRVCAVILVLLTAAPASAATKLVVTGRGWGHGVGMSQWGAYGYARHSWRWQRILAHYYPGTTLGDAPVSSVRVLLTAGRRRAAVACAGPMRVGDATGSVYALPPGGYGVGPALRLPVGHRRVRVAHARGHRERYVVRTVARSLRSPAVFDCPSAPLTLNGRAYHGTLTVRASRTRVSVVDTLPLDEYVRGVVAGEMPHRWRIAALAAQAVAARSYALATLKPGKHFDLFADTRSQVYGGIAYETPSTDAAVEKTAGKVLLWHGHVATTFFFSTSGGHTADVREVWPSFGDVPYLRGVDDPYDVISPHHAWGPVVLDAAKVARRLGVPPGDITAERTPTGHVRAVRIGSRTVDGDTFRFRLGLASTSFELGELSVVADRTRVRFGGKVALSLRASDVGPATLQRRIGAGVWRTLAKVDGARRVTVEPRAHTLYRLSSASVSGPVVPVDVTPIVRVAPVTADELTGTVLPAVRAPVTVFRRVGVAWRVVAHPRVAWDGRFQTQLRLRPGSYRIEVAGDSRYAAASASLRVTPRLLAALAR